MTHMNQERKSRACAEVSAAAEPVVVVAAARVAVIRGWDLRIRVVANHAPVSATTIVQYASCPFSVYCKAVGGITVPPTEAMAIGTMEHKIRELVTQKLTSRYVALSVQIPDGFLSENLRIISQTVDAVKAVTLCEFPHYVDHVVFASVDCLKRMIIEETARVCRAEVLLRVKVVGSMLAQRLWPVMTEEAITAWGIGLKGRIDEVYSDIDTFVPVDIKTGAGFLQKQNKPRALQLAVYALLAEFKWNKAVDVARIYHANIMQDELVQITPELRQEVVNLRDEVLRMMNSATRPKQDAVVACGVCNYCKQFGKTREGN